MRVQFNRPRKWLLALLLALAPLALAASEGDSPERIVVVGQGSADLAPDMAVVTLTVTREAKTAREALDANSTAMAEVMKAMRDRGVAERDLQTASFSIQPKYSQLPRNTSGERPAPQVVGYTVRNSLSVRVRDISKVGAVIDESVSLGVNEGGGIVFTNDDPSEALSKARVAAVKDARNKAQTLAGAAGVKVGRILEISEQSHVPGPAPMMRAEMSMVASARAVPVASGENTYRITVQMAVAIEQ